MFLGQLPAVWHSGKTRPLLIEPYDGTLWKEHTVDTPAFFRIITCNQRAAELWFTLDVDTWLTEDEYVVWLHKIRGRHI